MEMWPSCSNSSSSDLDSSLTLMEKGGEQQQHFFTCTQQQQSHFLLLFMFGLPCLTVPSLGSAEERREYFPPSLQFPGLLSGMRASERECVGIERNRQERKEGRKGQSIKWGTRGVSPPPLSLLSRGQQQSHHLR